MFKFAQKNVVINSLKKLESNSKSALVLNCQSKNKSSNADPKHKVSLITGSTSGIGLSIAESFAKHGQSIALNGFGSQDSIDESIKKLKKLGAPHVKHYPADMSKPDEINAMMDSVAKEFGKIDILVNNAGIQFVAPIDDFSPEKWELIIRVNLVSAFYTIKHALPLMKKNKWGRIVNVASLHGLVASPYKSAYVAAKHGIMGLTKTVALEVAEKNITVNAICPGYVKTPLVMNQLADTARVRGISEEDVIKNVMLLNQPTKKFVEVEEIAETAVFLCSENARSITGTHILVDGGWTAQ